MSTRTGKRPKPALNHPSIHQSLIQLRHSHLHRDKPLCPLSNLLRSLSRPHDKLRACHHLLNSINPSHSSNIHHSRPLDLTSCRSRRLKGAISTVSSADTASMLLIKSNQLPVLKRTILLVSKQFSLSRTRISMTDIQLTLKRRLNPHSTRSLRPLLAA